MHRSGANVHALEQNVIFIEYAHKLTSLKFIVDGLSLSMKEFLRLLENLRLHVSIERNVHYGEPNHACENHRRDYAVPERMPCSHANKRYFCDFCGHNTYVR